MEETVTVFLRFTEFGIDPDVVTALVGFQPSPGDSLVRTPKEKESWVLYSGLPRSASVEEQIDALLDAIEPHAEGIRAAASRYNGHILCGLLSDDRLFGFFLPARTIRRLAALGLGLMTDLYLFGNELEATQ